MSTLAPPLPTSGASRGGNAARMDYWSWWLLPVAIAWLLVMAVAFPEPAVLMRSNWPLILVGFVGAFIGNATAVGGGLVFVPILILVYDIPPVTALKLAIASQCFGMTSGAVGWLRRREVPVEALKVTVPALIIGSTISTLVIRPSAVLVKGLFGPVSIGVGLLMLVLMHRSGHRAVIPKHVNGPLFVVAVLGGLVTGWVAIGEGEIVAAFLILACGFRVERSIALGVVLLAINSVYLMLLHQFVLDGIPWHLAMFTGLGCVYGARLGPYLAQWIRPLVLKIGFAVIAILDGLVFVLQFAFLGGR
jgi:uncharacterized protein